MLLKVENNQNISFTPSFVLISVHSIHKHCFQQRKISFEWNIVSMRFWEQFFLKHFMTNLYWYIYVLIISIGKSFQMWGYDTLMFSLSKYTVKNIWIFFPVFFLKEGLFLCLINNGSRNGEIWTYFWKKPYFQDERKMTFLSEIGLFLFFFNISILYFFVEELSLFNSFQCLLFGYQFRVPKTVEINIKQTVSLIVNHYK